MERRTEIFRLKKTKWRNRGGEKCAEKLEQAKLVQRLPVLAHRGGRLAEMNLVITLLYDHSLLRLLNLKILR